MSLSVRGCYAGGCVVFTNGIRDTLAGGFGQENAVNLVDLWPRRNILLAVTDPQTLVDINQALGAEWEAISVASEEDVLGQFEKRSFDALLVDFNLVHRCQRAVEPDFGDASRNH